MIIWVLGAVCVCLSWAMLSATQICHPLTVCSSGNFAIHRCTVKYSFFFPIILWVCSLYLPMTQCIWFALSFFWATIALEHLVDFIPCHLDKTVVRNWSLLSLFADTETHSTISFIVWWNCLLLKYVCGSCVSILFPSKFY